MSGSRHSKVIFTLASYATLVLLNRKEKAFNVLFSNFMKIGGIYVKFLQLIVLRDERLSKDYPHLKDLLAVFDNAAVEDINVKAYIANPKAFLRIDTTPVATGSFAQVYAAQLTDGSDVVLKILRPSVVQTIKHDLRLLHIASSIIRFFRPDDFVNAKQIVEELEQMTANEINYEREVATATELYERFIDDTMIKIPKTYSKLSTKHLIVQERIHGLALTEALTYESPEQYILDYYNTDLRSIMEKLAYESLRANLSGHASHGDPHPGNIIILPNNCVALIDFGVYGIEINRKGELVSLLREYVHLYDGKFQPSTYTEKLIQFFVPDLVTSLDTVSISTGTNVREKVLSSLQTTINDIMLNSNLSAASQQMIANNQPLKLFMKIINRNNRFGITADMESLVLMRSTNMYLNLIQRLGLDHQVVKRAFLRIINEFEHLELHITTESDVSAQSLDSSLHYVSNWLEKMRYSDPITYTKLVRVIQ